VSAGQPTGFLLSSVVVLDRKVFFRAYIAFPLLLGEIHDIDGREVLENLHRIRKLQNLFFAGTDLGLLDAAIQLPEKAQGSVFIIFEGKPTYDSLCHLFKCFKAAQIGLGNPTVEWLVGASWDCDREIVWTGELE
jgi:hypothetical protein